MPHNTLSDSLLAELRETIHKVKRMNLSDMHNKDTWAQRPGSALLAWLPEGTTIPAMEYAIPPEDGGTIYGEELALYSTNGLPGDATIIIEPILEGSSPIKQWIYNVTKLAVSGPQYVLTHQLKSGVRVIAIQSSRVIYVRAEECSAIGESGSAQPMKWETDQFIEDESQSTITVADPLCQRIAITGEVYKVQLADDGETWIPAEIFGLERKVLVEEEIACGEIGTAKLKYNLPSPGETTNTSCEWTETSCSVQVCNSMNRKVGCDADEVVTAIWHEGECVGSLVYAPRAMRALATLQSPTCGGDEAEITGIVFTDVCTWEPRILPTDALNPLKLWGLAGKYVRLEWSDIDCMWAIVNIEPQQMNTYLTEARVYGCELQTRTRSLQIAVQLCDSSVADSAWTTVSGGAFTQVDNVIDTVVTAGYITHTYQTQTVICAGSTYDENTLIPYCCDDTPPGPGCASCEALGATWPTLDMVIDGDTSNLVSETISLVFGTDVGNDPDATHSWKGTMNCQGGGTASFHLTCWWSEADGQMQFRIFHGGDTINEGTVTPSELPDVGVDCPELPASLSFSGNNADVDLCGGDGSGNYSFTIDSP